MNVFENFLLERIERIGTVNVLVSPNHRQIENLHDRGNHGVRWICTYTNWYVWNAFNLIHYEVYTGLGLDRNEGFQGLIEKDGFILVDNGGPDDLRIVNGRFFSVLNKTRFEF